MVAVIIPTHNERKRIADVILGLPYKSRAIIVDDSTDGTDYIARQLGCEVLEMPRTNWNYVGLKYVYGLIHAKNQGYEFAATMDNGENFDPAWISLLCLIMDDSCDIAIGVRDFKGIGIRRLMSQAATALINRSFGLSIEDVTCGFRLYRTESLEFRQMSSRTPHAFQVEFLVQQMARGARVKTIKIPYRKPKDSTLRFETLVDWGKMCASLMRQRVRKT